MSLLICPNCKVGMKAVVRHDIEIDVCPECQGVWLDPGELDKFLALLQQKRPAPPVSFLPRDADGMPAVDIPFRPAMPPPHADVQRHSDYDRHDRDDHHGHDDEHYRRRDGYHQDDGKKRGWRGLMDIFD